MKVVVLSALKPHTGNLSSAQRISDHLSSVSGVDSVLADSNAFTSPDQFNQLVTCTQADCVVGVHAYRSGKLLGECPVPYGLVFGGTDINENHKNQHKLEIMTAAVKKAQFLVCFNSTMRDQALVLWPDIDSRLYTQPQGVVTSPSSRFDFHQHLHTTCGVPLGSSIFLLVAGLRPVKDPFYLVHKVSEWHMESREVYLVIMGPCLDVTLSEKVLSTIARLPGVEFVHSLPRDECHRAMQQCTALVNSSLSEGMSLSILEAMDLRVPVIVRNIPGNRTLVQHENNGLLYDTPEEFVRLAKNLLKSPEQMSTLTSQAKEFINTHHSAELEREGYVGLVKGIGAKLD